MDGATGTELRETQRNILSSVFDISHDLDDTSIKHLSDSRPAKLLHSVEDIPNRFTLVHAYIRALFGYSNLTKEGRRIQFVIRVSHNIEPKDFARSISVNIKEEIGAMC